MVNHPGRQQQGARPDRLVVRQGDRKLIAGTNGVSDRIVYEVHPIVRSQLLAREREKLLGRRAIPGQKPMHVVGKSIALAALVDQEHMAAASAQYQGRAQPGRATAHDYCVPDLAHGSRPFRRLPVSSAQTLLAAGTVTAEKRQH
jgi:hypothetical protein